MSADEDWWGNCLEAIPGPNDNPLTAADIRARFTVPRPSLDWVKDYLHEEESAGFVAMFALGSLGISNSGRWLHYRWEPGFFEFMGF